MKVNFTGNLIVDSGLKKCLKKSDLEDIVEKTSLLVQSPKISRLIDGDIYLSKCHIRGYGGEKLLIICENTEIPICSKSKIYPMQVIKQILLYICAKYNVRPLDASFNQVFKAFKKLK